MNETSPEGGDLQALAMFFLVLVLLVMLVVVIFSYQKLVKKHTMKVWEDVEEGEDNTAKQRQIILPNSIFHSGTHMVKAYTSMIVTSDFCKR